MKLICKNNICNVNIEVSACNLTLLNGEFVSDIKCPNCDEMLYPDNSDVKDKKINYSRPLWANAIWSDGSTNDKKDTYTF